MLAPLPRARGAVTAARTEPCGGQLVCVGGTGAVVKVGIRVEVGGGVLPEVIVEVELPPVGGGVTPVSPHATSKKMREQPKSMKKQRGNRVVYTLPSIRAFRQEYTFTETQ